MPSADADRSVLSDLEAANEVTTALCPKRQVLGVRSNDLDVVSRPHTEMVQSVPAVINVRESTNVAHESCP